MMPKALAAARRARESESSWPRSSKSASNIWKREELSDPTTRDLF